MTLLLIGAASPLRAQNVTELYVTPDTLRLRVSEKEGLSVQAFDNVGNAILRIVYKSSDERTVRVQPNGTVTALKPGSANVLVQAGKKTKTVKVFVSEAALGTEAGTTAPGTDGIAADPKPAPPPPAAPPALAALAIEPTTIYLLPAEHIRATLHGFRGDGSAVPSVRGTWKSLRSEIASVGDTTGVVTGIGAGQGVIQAIAAGGVTASVPVVVALTEFSFTVSQLVLGPEEAETLHVVVPAQNRRELRNIDLQWSSTDPAVARVGLGGVVEAVAPGKAEIIAGGFLQERRMPVVVHREIAGFSTRPALGETVQIPLNATREFKVRPEASDSSPIPEVTINWQLPDTAVASFDTATGVLTARKLGTTLLGFGARGVKSKSWTIRVVPGVVGLDRQRVALAPGQRISMAASALDEQGQAIGPAQDVNWSSSDPAVAAVRSDGTVEALGLGRATMTAAVRGGQPASAQVFVVGDLLVSSLRQGRFGIYTLLLRAPQTLYPVLVDTFSSVHAVYSPDRTRIAFSSDRSGAGNFDIYVVDADGKNPLRLTTAPGVDNEPAWTSDGRQIVFTSVRSGSSQIYIMKADGSDVRQLTNSPGGNQEPSVSPGGGTIVFTSGRDGNLDLYTMDLAGVGQVNLTNTRDVRESSPHLLANGDLVYTLERKEAKGRAEIVRQAAGSATRTSLVDAPSPVAYLGVSRDGERLAYVLSRVTDRAKGTTEVSFFLQAVSGGGPISVPLLPGEKVVAPDF